MSIVRFVLVILIAILSFNSHAEEFVECPDDSFFIVEGENGVRYGWYNDSTCIVSTANEHPECPDDSFFTVEGENGVRYGWYNDSTCIVSNAIEHPQCPDDSFFTVLGEDGVKYGWYNDATCIVSNSIQEPTDENTVATNFEQLLENLSDDVSIDLFYANPTQGSFSHLLSDGTTIVTDVSNPEEVLLYLISNELPIAVVTISPEGEVLSTEILDDSYGDVQADANVSSARRAASLKRILSKNSVSEVSVAVTDCSSSLPAADTALKLDAVGRYVRPATISASVNVPEELQFVYERWKDEGTTDGDGNFKASIPIVPGEPDPGQLGPQTRQQFVDDCTYRRDVWDNMCDDELQVAGAAASAICGIAGGLPGTVAVNPVGAAAGGAAAGFACSVAVSHACATHKKERASFNKSNNEICETLADSVGEKGFIQDGVLHGDNLATLNVRANRQNPLAIRQSAFESKDFFPRDSVSLNIDLGNDTNIVTGRLREVDLAILAVENAHCLLVQPIEITVTDRFTPHSCKPEQQTDSFTVDLDLQNMVPPPGVAWDPSSNSGFTNLYAHIRTPSGNGSLRRSLVAKASNGPSKRVGGGVYELGSRPTLNCCVGSDCPCEGPNCRKPRTVSWGDPHLITLDGLKYDFQSMGEFVLVKSNVTNLEVQVRQKKFSNDNITVNTAVAANIDGTKVSIHLGGVLYVDDNIHAGDIVLEGGGGVAQTNSGYRLTWQDGSVVDVAVGRGSMRVSFAFNDQHREKITGLVGNWDGDSSNDIRVRNGEVLARPVSANTLYKRYADSWRILQEKSLFHYEIGKTTLDHTDLTIPRSVFTVDDLDPTVREFAEGVCVGVGLLSDDELFKDCVIDVALMGEDAAEPYRTDIDIVVTETIDPKGEIQARVSQITTGVSSFSVLSPNGDSIPVFNVGSLDPNWVMPSIGNWIAPDRNGSFNHPIGSYRYSTTFQAFGAANKIDGVWASDDGIEIRVNGETIVREDTVGIDTHNRLHEFSIQSDVLLTEGENTLTVIIGNAGGPTGLYLNAEVVMEEQSVGMPTAICSCEAGYRFVGDFLVDGANGDNVSFSTGSSADGAGCGLFVRGVGNVTANQSWCNALLQTDEGLAGFPSGVFDPSAVPFFYSDQETLISCFAGIEEIAERINLLGLAQDPVLPDGCSIEEFQP